VRANLLSVCAIGKYVLLEALRSRVLWLAGVFLLTGFVLTHFVSEVAITEVRQFQSGFLCASLRLCAVCIICLFVTTGVAREFDDKVLELILSSPLPRWTYFLGKLLGFAGIGVCIAVMYSLPLLSYAPTHAVVIWGLSLASELVLMVSVSLLALFTFSQVTAALSVVFAFYFLARSISALQLIGDSPIVYSTSVAQQVLTRLLDGVAYLLPDLDRFTSSAWVVYGQADLSQLVPVLAQTGVYLLFLSGAALFDLYRRNL